MNKTTKGSIFIAAVSITVMLLSPWQRYCLKCWTFYPIYKFVIGGFHNDEQYIDGYYYYVPEINPPEEIAWARAYEPTSDDLIISTYPKSGTHFAALMMIHLLSKGKLCQERCDQHAFTTTLEFTEHAAGAVSKHLPKDMYPTNPRIVGTHMPAPHLKVIGGKAKYLVVIRNPVKQLLSRRTMDFFLFGHILRLPLEEFITLHIETRETGWADHVHHWWRHRNLPNVQILFYEDMVKFPEATVRKVAKFTEVELNEEQVKVVVERMSKEWAIKHVDGSNHTVATPFSPPAHIQEYFGTTSMFLVDHSKFFSTKTSEQFTPSQEERIRSNAKAKLLALDDADGISDGADLIKNCPGYFSGM